jgi:prophage regulatory protein
VKKLIKLKDVLGAVPVSRSQLYAMIAEGKFPRQVHLGGSAAFWVEEEVSAWIQAHIDADRGEEKNQSQ